MSYPIEFLYGPGCFEYYYGPYGPFVYSSASKRDMLKVYNVRLVSITAEQIDLDMARKHLRIETDNGSPPSSEDDDWLTLVGIPAARDWCEQYLGQSIATQILEVSTQGFPSTSFDLPFGPVLSVIAVQYADVDSNVQFMPSTDYAIDTFASPTVLRLTYGASWPTALDAVNSVTVQYEAGYNLPSDVPQTIPLPKRYLAAMLLVLGHLYENRENSSATMITEIPLGVNALLQGRDRLRLSMA